MSKESSKLNDVGFRFGRAIVRHMGGMTNFSRMPTMKVETHPERRE